MNKIYYSKWLNKRDILMKLSFHKMSSAFLLALGKQPIVKVETHDLDVTSRE